MGCDSTSYLDARHLASNHYDLAPLTFRLFEQRAESPVLTAVDNWDSTTGSHWWRDHWLAEETGCDK